MQRLKLTLGLALAALGAATGIAAAGAHKPALAPYDILNRVREAGLGPTALPPIRRGPNYVLHAIDQNGVEMRVVADAHFGDILSVRPARPWIDFYVRSAARGPHIIRVRDSKNPNDTVDEAPTPGFAKVITIEPDKRD